MTFAESVQPCGNAIQVHGLAAVLRKYEVLVFVVFAQPRTFLCLPCPIFVQEFHGFGGEGDKAVGSDRFEAVHINAPVGAIEFIVTDVDFVSIKVYLVPLQVQDFPAPCIFNQQHMNEGSPLDGFQLQGVPDNFHLFWLEASKFTSFQLWQRGLAGNIEGNERFPFNLIQHGGD